MKRIDYNVLLGNDFLKIVKYKKSDDTVLSLDSNPLIFKVVDDRKNQILNKTLTHSEDMPSDAIQAATSAFGSAVDSALIELTPEETRLLKIGSNYTYEIECHFSNGRQHTLQLGRLFPFGGDNDD